MIRPNPDPKSNQLLAALPRGEWERWLSQLEAVEMPLGQVLYESGTTLGHVYFPTTSIVSLLYVMENGSSAEIAVVGNEGIVGISLFMGGESTPSRAVVQSAGQGFRLKAKAIKEEFNRAPVLTCCFATRRHSSRRWRKRPSATGTTRSISSSAAGCC